MRLVPPAPSCSRSGSSLAQQQVRACCHAALTRGKCCPAPRSPALLLLLLLLGRQRRHGYCLLLLWRRLASAAAIMTRRRSALLLGCCIAFSCYSGCWAGLTTLLLLLQDSSQLLRQLVHATTLGRPGCHSLLKLLHSVCCGGLEHAKLQCRCLLLLQRCGLQLPALMPSRRKLLLQLRQLLLVLLLQDSSLRQDAGVHASSSSLHGSAGQAGAGKCCKSATSG